MIFKESREFFEQPKGARHAHSHAKTGLDYAHVRLASLEWKEAVAFPQSIHVIKHVAESCPELAEVVRGKPVSQLGRNAFKCPESCRTALEDSADNWNGLRPSARLQKSPEYSLREEEGSDALMPARVTSEPFHALAAALKESGFTDRGTRLENVLNGTWTTSSEMISELGAVVVAIRKECRPLTANEKALIKECMKQVRTAWPGFSLLSWLSRR